MKGYTKPKYEVADVLGKYGQSYRQSKKLQHIDHSVMNAILSCRTKALGGHKDKCYGCDYERNSYNSCRNRHCPKCQGMQQMKWIDKRSTELLPVRYFHLVFTLPAELNRLCLMNKKLLYGVLFKASTQATTMLARDEKHLGATPGIISVLHTWGQNLMDHPHIHMIVTGGGMSVDGKKWINSKKKFFLPVRVMSQVFRGKFLAMLKDLYYSGQLTLEGSMGNLRSEKQFKALLSRLYEKPWVVYAKKPFGNAPQVLRYLGRYTHRIALSNHRIVDIENNTVKFRYKDYADSNRQKTLTLSAHEFIRRFLLHVLPGGFFKIRYYGLVASRSKKDNLARIRNFLRVKQPVCHNDDEPWQERLLRMTGFDVRLCPNCKKDKMQTVMIIEKQAFP